MLLQIVRHGGRERVRTVVEGWSPPEYLVELQEHAGRRLLVCEAVLLGAGPPGVDVHVTHLASRWRELEIAVVNVLTAAGFVGVTFVS